ncbi:hypothetical protein [Psychrobacter jeotgali]|uniref:hypothetical protein n=1 Tax=Psychrobacter jeotgali TaxID=179010 RepID=UPI0019190D25|nr:hypothetical protein [Psychrobacter jeotgali]
MLNSYRAVIEEGKIKWLDTPPLVTSAQVIVTVLSPVEKDTSEDTQGVKQKRKLGFMQGEMTVPDDIHWGDERVQDLFGVE